MDCLLTLTLVDIMTGTSNHRLSSLWERAPSSLLVCKQGTMLVIFSGSLFSNEFFASFVMKARPGSEFTQSSQTTAIVIGESGCDESFVLYVFQRTHRHLCIAGQVCVTKMVVFDFELEYSVHIG